jgi:hypothetical protein
MFPDTLVLYNVIKLIQAIKKIYKSNKKYKNKNKIKITIRTLKKISMGYVL